MYIFSFRYSIHHFRNSWLHSFCTFGKTKTCSHSTNSRATMGRFEASGSCRRFERANKGPVTCQKLPNRRFLKMLYCDRNFVHTRKETREGITDGSTFSIWRNQSHFVATIAGNVCLKRRCACDRASGGVVRHLRKVSTLVQDSE